MAILGKRVSVPIIPGVMPLEDSTELDTLYFTNSDKIRFQNGKLRKIKGWQRIFSTNFQRITGAARNIFSYTSQFGLPITIVGTNTRLYAVINSTFFNITPLQVTTNTIASAFSTEYNTGSYIIATTLGSSVVSIYIPQYLNSNDSIQIGSMVGTINGIPAAAFNNTFSANVINDGQIQINVGIPATSTGTVTETFQWATSYLFVTIPNNGSFKGDRVKILASTAVANIPAIQINIENYITNIVSPNTFTIQTDTIATSKVTGGGGASTTVQYQIAAGNIDESEGFGYGAGNYGTGRYGVQGQFGSVGTYPRIWSMDVFGTSLVLTPGDPVSNSTDNLYAWNNDVTTAPVLISSLGGASGVPLAVKWVYVSHNTVVTLGSAGVLNKYVASDTGSFLIWTPGPSTNAFSTIIEQAGPLISQGTSRNRDCVFTENEVYLFEFVSKPFIWNIRKLFTTDGIIGPKARAEVEDAIFWMGQGDFFIFDGTSVNIIPNNTVKRFVYDNVNFSQASKIVAFANVEYNEVWWFIPFGNDSEPNNYVKYNYKDGVWDIGTLNRSAAEEPLTIHELPWLIQSVISKTLDLPNAVRTYFFSAATGQIGNNPLTTTISSQAIEITVIADCYLQAGDYIFISGAITTNGIPAGEINGVKQIVSVTQIPVTIGSGYGEGGYGEGGYGFGTDTFGYESQIVVNSTSTSASSSGTGGGNAITIGTNIIGLVFPTDSGIDPNELITVAGVQDIGGIPGSQINGENIPVRFVNGNIVEIEDQTPMTIFSTSLVVGGSSFVTVTYTPSDRLFMHEYGSDDYNPNYNPVTDPPYNQYIPLLATVQTNYAQIGDGDQTMVIYTIYPDTFQTVNSITPPLPAPPPILELTVNGRLYAQSQTISPTITAGPFNITPNTNKIDLMLVARQRQYIIESNTLGADFVIGKWIEEVKPSSTR